MITQKNTNKAVDEFFSGKYEITDGYVIPDIRDIEFGKKGRELELTMLFIDIRESTKIVGGFRRETAARMYKSFLWGVAKIAKENEGELRSFNGDGVLVAFVGDRKRTNATKAAMQMSWFVKNVLKPKVESYFENNNELKDIDFNFGIGIECGKVLVVRGGIRGENNNDLVWVGNATNISVKLSSLSSENKHIYISEDVYKNMNDSTKFGGKDELNMWEAMIWTGLDSRKVYTTSWNWALPLD